MIRFCLISLMLTLPGWLPGVSAQPLVNLTDYQAEYPLGKSVAYLADPAGVFTLQQIKTSRQFVQSQQETPSFGFSPGVYWFRCQVRNHSVSANRRYVMELNYAHFRTVDLYVFNGHGHLIGQSLAGDSRGAAHRPLPTHQYVFPLNLLPGEEQIIYLRCDGMASKIFPLTIYEQYYFLGLSQRWSLWFGFYFGFITIIAFYHLIRYLYTKERGYLYFSLYLFFFWLSELVRGNGNYAERLVLIYHPFWQRHVVELLNGLIVLTSIFWLNFYRQGLQIGRTSQLSKLITGLWIINTGLFVVVLTGLLPVWAPLAFNFYVPLAVYLTILTICMIRVGQGFTLAWYYLTGTVLLFAGVVISFLNRLGWLPGTGFYWHNTVQLASVSEIVLLSFGFAESYRQERLRTKFDLERSYLHGRKKEREWLSFVMHHQFGSTITFLQKQLNRLKHNQLDTADQRLLTDIQQRLANSEKDLRTLAVSLFPQVLDKYGLLRALEVSVANFDSLGETRFLMESIGTAWKFDEQTEFELYLIGLELLNNVLRHAEATSAWLTVHWQPNGVFQLTMRDNGVGFEATRLQEGHGFNSTRQLVETVLTGEFIVESTPGKGTTIRISVPEKGASATNRTLIRRLFGAIRSYWKR